MINFIIILIYFIKVVLHHHMILNLQMNIHLYNYIIVLRNQEFLNYFIKDQISIKLNLIVIMSKLEIIVNNLVIYYLLKFHYLFLMNLYLNIYHFVR